jgi:hypothetical protein
MVFRGRGFSMAGNDTTIVLHLGGREREKTEVGIESTEGGAV